MSRTDWAQVLDELRAAGYSPYRIAKLLGRKWDTVQAWREGEPKHSDGEALLRLHTEATAGRVLVDGITQTPEK